jgi:hypothetical protein
MRRLRITGLVGFAKRVRQEVSSPISPQRLAELRLEVEDCTRSIGRIFREKGARETNLAPPSRKAYQFLKSLDLDSVVAQDTLEASQYPPDSISFPGLASHFEWLLDLLARYEDREGREVAYEEIVSDTESIEREIEDKQIRPEHLRRQSREIRGWLAYFSQRENFDAYCAAVERAESAFRAASTRQAGPSVAVLVQFRPMHGMYRIRSVEDVITVRLPAPMICYDQALFQSLAAVAFRKSRDKKAVHEAAAGEPYQRIVSALETLGGVVTQARGLHHDLAAAFDRVNTAYFNGILPRPRLTWNRTFAARKLGHYDHAHDTVVLNAVLDKPTVPQCVIDFIVYHELLHKQLGVVWKSTRMTAHTPEFQHRERQFRQYEQAKAVLRQLAAER